MRKQARAAGSGERRCEDLFMIDGSSHGSPEDIEILRFGKL
jgi:hypothetical protein